VVGNVCRLNSLDLAVLRPRYLDQRAGDRLVEGDSDKKTRSGWFLDMGGHVSTPKVG